MKKKLYCILFIVLLVIPVFSSCKPSTSEESTVSKSSDSEIPGLQSRNFGGKDIKILTVDKTRENIYFDCELASESVNGTAINDASYERTQILKDKYGINLKVSYTANPSKDYKNSIIAGENTYQIMCDGVVYLSDLGKSGYLRDLNKIPNLNLKSDWWDQSAVNDLSTAGYNFYLTGDLIVSDKNATWVCFFNKDLLKVTSKNSH